jgi:hypothetical protein
MKIRKSLYLLFYVGAACAFAGGIFVLIDTLRHDTGHTLGRFGVWLVGGGLVVYGLPAFGAVVLLLYE